MRIWLASGVCRSPFFFDVPLSQETGGSGCSNVPHIMAWHWLTHHNCSTFVFFCFFFKSRANPVYGPLSHTRSSSLEKQEHR